MLKRLLLVIFLVLVCSCATKKDILYLQDVNDSDRSTVNYQNATIQPNDILKISVESLVAEAALPYNRITAQGMQPQNIQLLQLDGYLVSTSNTIVFPILGELSTSNKTTYQLAEYIKRELVSGGHLSEPTVSVRLINAKVTILGEVNNPVSYTHLTLPTKA